MYLSNLLLISPWEQFIASDWQPTNMTFLGGPVQIYVPSFYNAELDCNRLLEPVSSILLCNMRPVSSQWAAYGHAIQCLD